MFLNLGLAQLEDGDLDAATDNLRQAVLLGENHAESHFNLALVYEQRGLHTDAEREAMASLRLNPQQPDTRNLLGVIYAREGRTAGAWLVWRELMREAPEYEPARKNLALLGSQNEVVLGETAVVVLPGGRRQNHRRPNDTTLVDKRNRSSHGPAQRGGR